jgi:hypothetical protein
MKKIFTLKMLLIAMLLSLFIVNIDAQTWTIYDGGVLPDAATPAWTAGDIGTPPTYSIMDDPAILNNKFLKETTVASGDKQSYKLFITKPSSGTWMIRVKAGNNPTSTEFEMNAKLGVDSTRCYFRLVNNAKGGYLKTNYLTTNITYPADTTLTVKEFHTYRITVENGVNYKIYLDENLTPIVTGTGSAVQNNQCLRFGDIGSNFTEGYIDWMAWDATGAYGPGTILPDGVIVDGFSTQINNAIRYNLKITSNPVADILTIENAQKISSYEIVGINGKLFSKGVNKSNLLSTNVSNLKTGIYIIKLYTNGKSEQIKFVKK